MWWPGRDDAQAWASAYETPYYVYDLQTALHRIRQVRVATEDTLQVWFAVKANGNRSLLAALRPDLDGLDVASDGELALAQAAGFEGSQVGFAGPGKTRAALRAAVMGGATVSVESLAELDALADEARALGARARALIRVNPSEQIHAFRVSTHGGFSPFGIPEADLAAAVERAQRSPDALDVEGVHVHAGSQCTSAAAWFRHAVRTFDLADQARRHGLQVRTVNLGGGLGVLADAPPLDLPALGRKLADATRKLRTSLGAQLRVIIEPGRYLLAEAGCFVTRVVQRRDDGGRALVVMDGGMSAYLFATERFHDGPPVPIVNLSRPEAPTRSVTVVGPACTPLDVFGRDLQIADPQPGDLLGLGYAGAYGYTASPLLFLGHRAPAELLREGGSVRCIASSFGRGGG